MPCFTNPTKKHFPQTNKIGLKRLYVIRIINEKVTFLDKISIKRDEKKLHQIIQFRRLERQKIMNNQKNG